MLSSAIAPLVRPFRRGIAPGEARKGSPVISGFAQAWRELCDRGGACCLPRRDAIFDVFHEADACGEAGARLGIVTGDDYKVSRFEANDWESGVPRPPLGQNFVEWLDLLESVFAARENDEYLFVELGAGYGRWSARALAAADRLRIPRSRAILVEGEPQHAAWARQHLTLNGFSAERFDLVEAAVGPKAGREKFIVVSPDRLTNRDWYGQAVAADAHLAISDTRCGDYLGRPLFLDATGWGAIEVPCRTLADVLPPKAVVDLLDMDIQGAEAAVVESSLDLLDRRVRRVHIGTHSQAIEERLRVAFRRLNWIPIWDFPLNAESPTPFGTIRFRDGLQSWINPRPL